ncbi:excisionase family DNA-binding protein [Devosia sp. A369]
MNLIAGLIHALPLDQRRVFNLSEAASYMGVSSGHFDKLVAAGTLPSALPYGRIRRWDKTALDYYLDRTSALPSKLALQPATNAYDTWSAARGQG